MNNFDISDIKKGSLIHMVGISGISMSGLAEILIKIGYKISGSDLNSTNLTQKLEGLGALIHKGHSEENIKNPSLVVYTAAISSDNPELAAAKSKGIMTIERSVLLGGVMRHFKKSIAVSGTHGKTSTTAMLSHIFLTAKLDPTISIGGELSAIGGNIRAGESDFFITESCEYHRSFLEFFPLVSIILNVDADHLDYFKDIDDIISAFKDFALLTPENGALIVNADDSNTLKAVQGTGKKIITVSAQKAADYEARNIVNNEFDIYNNEKILCHVKLSVFGAHHVSNSLCAFAAAHFLGLEPAVISQGLEEFCGVKRRFEIKGKPMGVVVIDDYAHHPTEIKATLKTLKALPHKNIYLVFQPHTYTRTKALLDDFAEALNDDIKVIITDIYAAREKDNGKIHASDLSAKISGAKYIGELEDIVDYLFENVKQGDIVMTMGAGNVYNVGESLIYRLNKKK